MKKPKYIESHEEINYKKALKEFQAIVNPDKYSDEEIERIKKELISKRGHYNK